MIIYVCTVRPYFHSSTAAHVDCFYDLAIERNAARSIWMCVSFLTGLFNFL